MFKAVYLTQDEEKNVSAEIADLDEADLPENNVAIDVEYSTINYKDGLAIMGKPGVVRNYPMIHPAKAPTIKLATKSCLMAGKLESHIGVVYLKSLG